MNKPLVVAWQAAGTIHSVFREKNEQKNAFTLV
jgi:hypothetical protein